MIKLPDRRRSAVPEQVQQPHGRAEESEELTGSFAPVSCAASERYNSGRSLKYLTKYSTTLFFHSV